MIYLDNNQETQKVAIDITAGGGQYYSIVPENPNIYYTQQQVDNKFTRYYDKEETLNTEQIETGLFVLRRSIEDDAATTYYNREQTDELISNVEVDLSDYYTKSETDELISNVEVDLTDYYTKEEVDSMVSSGDGGAYILECLDDYFLNEYTVDGEMIETEYIYEGSDRQQKNKELLNKIKNNEVKSLFYAERGESWMENITDENGNYLGDRTVQSFRYIPVRFEMKYRGQEFEFNYSKIDSSYIYSYKIVLGENAEMWQDIEQTSSSRDPRMSVVYNESMYRESSGKPLRLFEVYIKSLVTTVLNNNQDIVRVKVPDPDKTSGVTYNGMFFMQRESSSSTSMFYPVVLYVDSKGNYRKATFRVTRSSSGTLTFADKKSDNYVYSYTDEAIGGGVYKLSVDPFWKITGISFTTLYNDLKDGKYSTLVTPDGRLYGVISYVSDSMIIFDVPQNNQRYVYRSNGTVEYPQHYVTINDTRVPKQLYLQSDNLNINVDDTYDTGFMYLITIDERGENTNGDKKLLAMPYTMMNYETGEDIKQLIASDNENEYIWTLNRETQMYECEIRPKITYEQYNALLARIEALENN